MAPAINIRQLECFLAVAEELHFGRAALRLHLGPSSVSEAVAALERRLGGRLFERTSRTVRLTVHGERFLHEVREPFDRIVRAHQRTRDVFHGQRRVVLAHTPELGQVVLPLLLRTPGASDTSPAVPWNPVRLHTAEQIRGVEDGTVDIGLCWSASVEPPLATTVLAEVPIVAVLREDDPLAAQDEITMSCLRTRPLVVTARRDNVFIDSTLQSAFLDAGVPFENVAEVAWYDDLVVHVVTEARIGVHPGTIALVNRVPGVVFRPIVEPSPRVTIRALTRSPPDEVTARVLAELVRITRDLGVLSSAG